ncbi:hypothetical protein [Allostreptomyces psammosilenae]|uniref:Uncharacterized protein n=1 Tax=Allostreptomyces psammosilenae TaxID=1892865 RepID=A0A852ZST5_9ACTN|nr:hypothetical protein [Allostreptomyces psammosilenae]NYI05463.1 hypothetical protein [Allostreptomyces psammosilenae]
MPGAVRASSLWWLTAIGAGVFDTVLAVVDALATDSAGAGGLVGPVAFRLTVYAVLVAVVLRMRAGRNWARIGLAALLGTVGMASLLIEPVTWLAEGNSVGDAFAGADAVWVLFVVSRVVHVVAVVAAIVCAFRPEANRYFRAGR